MITPYPWQIPHVNALVESIWRHGVALDASDTGTGKTICALIAAQALELKPFVITRKSIIPTWWHWMREVSGLEFPQWEVVNYEKARRHGIPNQNGTLYIFDEAHEASGVRTQNSHLLMGTSAMKRPILMLSATAAHSPLKLYGIGHALHLHNGTDFYRWCMAYGCKPNPYVPGGHAWLFCDQQANMERLHEAIFPKLGSRMRKAEIPDFPEVQNIVECYDLPPPPAGIAPWRAEIASRVAEAMEEMTLASDEAVALSGPGPGLCQLTEVLYDRMETELDKVGLLLELACDSLEEGMSVVIFVNFRGTLEALQELGPRASFRNAARIIGGQDDDERAEEVEKFQKNQARICLATIDSGSLGLSLHDLQGGHPRIAYLCPCYRAVSLRQAMGRIHRAGAKSKAINKLVFAASSIEARVAKIVEKKLAALDTLNDGDLDSELALAMDVG